MICRSESHPVGLQDPPGVGDVQVPLRHRQRAVPREVLHELGRHPRLQHLGDARVLAEVFSLPADIVCGRLHDGKALLGGGILAGERVPAAVEFTIYLGAEQCGVSVPLLPVLDAVAAYAHAFEFVAGGVKRVVKDVGLFVLSDLGGSEIDERCCHRRD